MVIGLGPLTLLRPLAVAAACLGAVLNGGGGSALLVGTIAGAAVLCVEPAVHRRWYHQRAVENLGDVVRVPPSVTAMADNRCCSFEEREAVGG
ncbi:hypothetical protein ACR6C2_21860 [Streptomyces sp. INA 01156]